jgi:hypothetical protein
VKLKTSLYHFLVSRIAVMLYLVTGEWVEDPTASAEEFSTPSLTSGKKMFTVIEHFLTNSYYNNSMFGKAKCKLCGDDVRFALRHLKQKHPEVLADKDVAKLNMSRVIEKYFD